ncbi:MAG: hypothetical protein QME79_02150 [Bacillota bacterium]|nr:hypothetical protein [Bacillota bacterium]
MAERRKLTATLVLLLILAAVPAQAADLGARAMGMGGAYVALANDASAVYWNPAGLSEVSWVSLTPVVAIETSGVKSLQSFMEAVDPERGSLPTENFSLTASGSGLAGIVTKRFGVSYLPSARVTAEYTYNESSTSAKMTARATVYNDTVLSAAVPLARAPFNLAAVSVGGNFKFIQGKYYYSSDATIEESTPPELTATGNGWALDLGAQAKVSERLRLGVAARDLVRNVSWSGTSTPAEANRPTLAAGAAFKAPLGFTIAADVENTREDGRDFTRLRAGFEQSLFGLVALRGGVRTNPDNQKPTFSLGFGAGLFKFLRLELAVASDLQDRLEGCLTGILQF